MRHTLRLLLIGAAMPLLADAQVPPPERPVRPPSQERPERPLPAERPARPVPSPRPLIEPRLDFDLHYDLKLNTELLRERSREWAELQKHDFRLQAEEMRLHAQDMQWQAKELAKIDIEKVRMEAMENLKNTRFQFDFGPSI